MHYMKSNRFKRVALAVSGGVDSAVSGILLKKTGFHDVFGVFMTNWDNLEESGQCNLDNDKDVAHWVCKKLDIPFKDVDFIKDYWNHVFVDLIESYTKGYTPNPDVLCNRYIKFDKFFDYSVERLGVDAIATGHYARTSFGKFLENYQQDRDVRLLKSLDERKDQTFFLCNVPQKALRNTMFPIGDLNKTVVKQIAADNGLERLLLKKESRGMCFVGKRKNFKAFIAEYIPKARGEFIDVESGKSAGLHNGIHNYTVGQRCNVPGTTKPYYIVKKCMDQTIYVALGRDHPALSTENFDTEPAFWIAGAPKPLKTAYGGVFECEFRFQHGHPLRRCRVVRSHHGGLLVSLIDPLDSIAPGQYAVFYLGDECLGAARIRSTGPSLFAKDKRIVRDICWTGES